MRQERCIARKPIEQVKEFGSTPKIDRQMRSGWQIFYDSQNESRQTYYDSDPGELLCGSVKEPRRRKIGSTEALNEYAHQYRNSQHGHGYRESV